MLKANYFYCDYIATRTNKMIEDIKFIEEERWNKQQRNKIKKWDKEIIREYL